MSPSTLHRAGPAIRRVLAGQPLRVLRRSDLQDLYSRHRAAWNLASSTTFSKFAERLISERMVRLAEFPFAHRTETRYLHGEPSVYEVAAALFKNAYFSHFSAAYIHGITEQIPRTVYLNVEQSPKPRPSAPPTQSTVDVAFRRPQRLTSNKVDFDGFVLTLLNGKNTKRLGVFEHALPEGPRASVTDLERTLIDLAVRPVYGGGPPHVLGAYRVAAERVSIARLLSHLKKLDYVYPYHQAIGFYMERSGAYAAGQLSKVRKLGLPFRFYLTYGMRDAEFDSRWQIHYPRGL